MDSLWDADLASVQTISKHNKVIQDLLVVVDVFSRFLWVVPLMNKTAQEVIKGLQQVLSQGRKCKTFRFDKGSEFRNQWVKTFLKKQNIYFYYTDNETKANYSEVAIRTLKSNLYRYFRSKHTFNFQNVLQDVVNNYNNRPHTSLGGLKPSDENKINEDEVRFIAFSSLNKTRNVKKKVKTQPKIKRLSLSSKSMI